VNPAAAVSRPTVVRLRAGTRSIDLSLDDEGRAELPQPWTLSSFSLQILQSETAYSIQGQQFVPLDPGISDLKLDGRSLKPHPAHLRVFPCGSGPDLRIGGQVLKTALRASTLELLRGRSVPLELCGSDEIALGITATSVLARPTSLFRVDTVSLTRVSAQPSITTTLEVHRDGSGAPVDVQLPRRSGPSLLVLPQNFNEGWTARVGNRVLEPQRADGWKQGWIVAGGDPVTVTFDYEPETTFRIALGAGVAGLVLCLLGTVLWPRRSVRQREPRPALGTGAPWLLDVVVVVAAGGLLVGWYGVGAMLAGLVAGRVLRRDGWGWLSAAAMLLVGAGLSWDRITQASWANDWRQAWSLAAVACLVAALGSSLPMRLRALLLGRDEDTAARGSSTSPR